MRKLDENVEYEIGKTFVLIRNKSTGYRALVKKVDIGHGQYMITPKMIRAYYETDYKITEQIDR